MKPKGTFVAHWNSCGSGLTARCTSKVLVGLRIEVAVLLATLASCVSTLADTAVLYALPTELAALKQELRMVGEPVRIADRQFHVGYQKGEKIVLAQSGSGQIPAAITTQAVIQRFKPDRLISIGPAGNLQDELAPTQSGWKVGDVIVASEVIHYEAGSEKSAGFILKEPGKVKPEFAQKCEMLRSDAVQIAMLIVGQAARLPTEENGGKPEVRPTNVHIGRIASGDKFIATTAKRNWLRETFQADAVDMMSAAIAKTCEANDVPFVLIRVLSDDADENATADFGAFIQEYKEPVTARIAIAFIDRIVAEKNQKE